MEISDATNYLSINKYSKAISAQTQFTKSVLIAYAQCSSETRDRIIRNFIARSISAMNGIIQLWRSQDYHDCWLLYRAILDRLFYLESLGRENKFELFDDWCFVKRYRYKRRCLKDSKLIGKLDSSHFIISEQDKKRYKEIKKEQTMWTPPKAYEVASSMKLDILYHYGYAFASMYVHPSAIEGEEDYSRLTGKLIKESFDDQMTVIHNAFIVTNLIISRGLFFSQLLWRSGVMKFIDDINRLISDGSEEYLLTLMQMKKMEYDNLALCRIRDHQATSQ